MGGLRYCFEKDQVKATLNRSKPSDLAVIDSDGISKATIQQAVSRGVMVYDYVNCGALEKERSYYPLFKHLRLAPYDGWDVLASAGGAVTHTVGKDENGNIMLIPVEEDAE